MKKYLPIVMTLLILIGLAVSVGTGAISYGVKVLVNGKYVDFSNGYGEPFLSDEGRTMVPVRGTAEAYGCTVEWDGPNYQAVVLYGDHFVIIPINKNYIITDLGTVSMDTWARIIDDRTYLPIRYVMEAVGAEVGWIASSKTVTIQTPDVVDDVPGGNGSTPVVEPPEDQPTQPEAEDDYSLDILKQSLQTHGKKIGSYGYFYQETTPANSSLISRLVYDQEKNQVYVLIEMDLDGSAGERCSSLRLNLNGSGNSVAYYSFSLLNAGITFDWSGHFDKARYSDSGNYVIDKTSSVGKNVNDSLMLNSMTVYQTKLALQALDRYCGSFAPGISSSSLGFSQ